MSDENKIITLPTAEATVKPETPAPVRPRAPLSLVEATKAMGALADLKAVSESKVLTPTTDAQKRGLSQYLTAFFSSHGEELLSNFFVTQQEYAPLLRAVSTIAIKVKRIIAQSEAAQELMSKQYAEQQAKQNQTEQ